VYHDVLFFHVRPPNEPIIRGVARYQTRLDAIVCYKLDSVIFFDIPAKYSCHMDNNDCDSYRNEMEEPLCKFIHVISATFK